MKYIASLLLFLIIASVIFLLTLVSAAADTGCNWNKPGANPYRGPVRESVISALKRYPDIPADAAAEITNKVRLLQPDTLMTITRDAITSIDGQVSNLRDMHHGKASVCRGPVQRSAWSDSHVEVAWVYCSGKFCIAIPIICGNVSRVDYVPFVPSTSEPTVRGFPRQPHITPSRNRPFSVPEPGTAAMLITGILLMAAVRKFK